MATFVVAVAVGTTSAEDLVLPDAMYASELPSQFYFEAEAVALWRSGGDTELWGDNSTFDLVSTRDLGELSAGTGLRVTGGGAISGQLGWQVGGFWAGTFSAASTTVYPSSGRIRAWYDPLITPGNLAFSNSNDANAFSVEESSSIGGLEASATWDLDGVRLSAGPRWIHYEAALGTVAYDNMDSYNGIASNIDRMDIASVNDLLGLQVGLEGMWPVFERVSVGGRASLGIYANNATLDRTYAADDGSSPFTSSTVSDTSTATAWAASLELAPEVRLALTEAIDLSFGATLLYLTGVDEPGTHFAAMGGDDGIGGIGLAEDGPSLTEGISFSGFRAGLHGHF